MAKDLTLEVLKQIRDQAKITNARLEKLEQTTDSKLELIRDEAKITNARLEKLERRQSETETRLATELVAGAVRELRATLV